MDAQNAVNHNLIGSYIVRDTTHVTFYVCAKSSMTTGKKVFNSACFERSYYYKMQIKINNSFNEIYSINNFTTNCMHFCKIKNQKFTANFFE